MRKKDNHFIGEETHGDKTIKDRTWIFDSIDGTAHYIKNSLFWGTQLVFIDKGVKQFSIIYLPKLNEMYYCINGKGVFLNHKKIEYIESNDISKSVIEFLGSSHKNIEEKVKIYNMLMKLKPLNFMHINASCVAYANLISGKTDVLISSVDRLWDVLPGETMLEELGVAKTESSGLKIYSRNKKLMEEIKDLKTM